MSHFNTRRGAFQKGGLTQCKVDYDEINENTAVCS